MQRNAPIVAAAAAVYLSGLALGQTRFEAISLTGRPAPHPSGPATFVPPVSPSGFSTAEGIIDSSGRISFWATVEVAGVWGHQVVTGDAGDLRFVLEIDGPVPNDPTLRFTFPRGLTSNDAGQVAVAMNAAPSNSASEVSGVFLFDPQSGLRTAVLEGSTVSNAPGARVTSILEDDFYPVLPALNARGEIAVRGRLSTRTTDVVLVADASGVRRVVGWPDALPLPDGSRVPSASIGDPRIDDAGRVAFFASASGVGLWRGETAATLVPVFVGNLTPLPTFPQGSAQFLAHTPTFFVERDWPVINALGTTLSVGNVNPPGTVGNGIRSVIAGTPGELKLVLRADRPIAGLPPGVTLANDVDPWFPYWSPVLNDSDGFAFQAQLSGAGVGPQNDAAVFGGTFDAAGLIAREGDPLPLLDPSATISLLGAPGVNDRDEIVLYTRSPAVAPRLFSHDAVWLAKPGRLRPLVLAGSAVRVGPGDVRTVAALTIGPGGVQDSQARVINNAGQVAVSLKFTDGSGGMFRATLCRADFDDSGSVEVPDLFAFLTGWFGSDPWADLDGNGVNAVADVFAYLAEFFAGC